MKKIFVLSCVILAVCTVCFMKTDANDYLSNVDNPSPTQTIVSLPLYSDTLPTSFTSPYVSSIKDQGVHGDCWIFAGLATLESNLKKMGFNNNEALLGYYDFSESSAAEGLTFTCSNCGKHVYYYDTFLNEYLCYDCIHQMYGRTLVLNSTDSGGFNDFMAGYLMSDGELVPEAQWGYNIYYPYVPQPQTYTKYDIDLYDCVMILQSDKLALKRAIISYGALAVTMDCGSAKRGNYVDSSNNFYYTFGSTSYLPSYGGHAVTLIGYDDNFDKANFTLNKTAILNELYDASKYGPTIEFMQMLDNLKVSSIAEFNALTSAQFRLKYLPKSNGAWLIKNSWGDEALSGTYAYANNTGYMWVSYEDLSFIEAGKAYAFTTAGVGTNNSEIYSYDEMGSVEFYAPDVGNPTKYTAANIYTFDSTKNLEHVTFSFSCDSSVNYKIYYAPYRDSQIVVSEKVEIASGTLNTSGYYTEFLSENHRLNPGSWAIMIEVDSLAIVYMGTDMPYLAYGDFFIEGEYYHSYANLNESYIITEGVTYNTLESCLGVYNFTIKAGVTNATVVYGDSNSDGNINPIDLTYLARFLSNWTGYIENENINVSNLDVNSDNSINPLDSTILSRHLANWSGYFNLPLVL